MLLCTSRPSSPILVRMRVFVTSCTSRPSSPTHTCVGHICGTHLSTGVWKLFVYVCTSRPSSPTHLVCVTLVISQCSWYIGEWVRECWYGRKVSGYLFVAVLTSRPSSPIHLCYVLVHRWVGERVLSIESRLSNRLSRNSDTNWMLYSSSDNLLLVLAYWAKNTFSHWFILKI